MQLHRQTEIELVPPTWVTLMQLGAHGDAESEEGKQQGVLHGS